MAADKAALASGADLGDGLRKRQPAFQPVPSFIPAHDTEDTKKLAKKVPMDTSRQRTELPQLRAQQPANSACRRSRLSKCLQAGNPSLPR